MVPEQFKMEQMALPEPLPLTPTLSHPMGEGAQRAPF